MNSADLRKAIESQINGRWDMTNAHRVDLRTALCEPKLVKAIVLERMDNKPAEVMADVWIVLVERHEEKTGYFIVAKSDGSKFGLAIEDIRNDKRFTVIGWYGDFLQTFEAM